MRFLAYSADYVGRQAYLALSEGWVPMPNIVPDQSLTHPAAWCQLDFISLAVAAENQRCLDLVEIGNMADALGVEIDISAAITSKASVSDVLLEIKNELILGNRAMDYRSKGDGRFFERGL